jgi:hypothetical protein
VAVNGHKIALSDEPLKLDAQIWFSPVIHFTKPINGSGRHRPGDPDLRRIVAIAALVRHGEASSGVGRLLELVHDRDGEVLRADRIADRAVRADAVNAGALAWRDHRSG